MRKKKRSPIILILVLLILIIIIGIGIYIIEQKNPETTKNEREKIIKVELFCSFKFTKCKDVFSIVYALKPDYENNDKVKFYYYDIDSTGNAYNAFLASLSAGKQNKEWEYIKLLFDNQEKFEDSDLVKYANILSLDIDKFNNDRSSEDLKSEAKSEFDYGNERKVTSAPTILIRDQFIQTNFDQETIKIKIDEQIQLLTEENNGQNT